MSKPALEISENCELFTRHGYVVSKSVLSNEEIIDTRRVAEELLDRLETPHGEPRFISGVQTVHEQFRKILANTRLRDSLVTVLGTDFLILDEMSLHDSFYANWHKDTSAPDLRGYNFFWDPNFNVLQVAIYLQDNADSGGGLDIVPGSHLLVDEAARAGRERSSVRDEGAAPPADFTPADRSGLRKFVKRTIDICTLGNARSAAIAAISAWNRVRSLDLPVPGFRLSPEERLLLRGQRIISKAGDVVMFNLRVTHRATPKKAGAGRKLAIFFTAGANNRATRAYHEWLREYSGEEKVSPMMIDEWLEHYRSRNDLRAEDDELGAISQVSDSSEGCRGLS